MARLAEELLQALKAAGAKAVFGLPGDYALPFFEVMERSKILPLYTLSHEPGIGFAADGAARYGGGIGVAAVTYGAGAMNLVNPIACAWAEHSPLVVISGAPGARETDHGLLLHHQIKTPETQMNVFKEFTCDQARLDNPVEAPAQIERVLRSCLKHSRPVYIEFPRDMVSVECEKFAHDFSRQSPVPPSLLQECIGDITERLGKSSRPVILAGAQVRRFGLEEEVFALASGWSVPLLNSFMGKGLFAGKAWPYAGSYLGLAGEDMPRELVENADFVIILGVIPCDTNWGISGKRLDENRTVLATADHVSVGRKSYPGLTLKHLVPELRRIAFRHQNANRSAVRASPAAMVTNGALRVDDIAPVLQQVIGASSLNPPLVADIGDSLFIAMDIPSMPLLASAYYATMGFAIPAAQGLQAATGERPIVLVGDGAFQMTGWELINCARYGWDPIVILLNNGSWEMLRQFQPDSDYTRLSAVSYATLAKGLGGETVTAHSSNEFARALDSALQKRGTFQLIELMLSPGDCTSTMKRYIIAIRDNMQKTV